MADRFPDTDSSYSEEGMEMRGIVNDHGEVYPYMFEPETSGDDTGSDSDVEDDMDRLGGTHWCNCGHCSAMPSVRESKCCEEIDRVKTLMDEEGVACITLHLGFEAVCLNPWVLRTAYHQYCQQYGGQAQEKTIHEKYRHTAYSQLVRMCWQFLGKEVWVVLPSCAVTRIRSAFPSEQYQGFRLPQL